jgi:hypothetical protein
MKKTYPLLFALLLFIFSCSTPEKGLDRSLKSNRNVCKKLVGKVLIYVVFVDTKSGPAWTDADIRSTIGFYQDAANWMGIMAEKNNIPLHIQVEYPSSAKAIKKDFPIKNVAAIMSYEQKDIKKLCSWSDAISKAIAVNLINENTTDSLPTVINPKDTERLIARLRNQHNTENVALVFTTNHPESSAIGLPMNTLNNENIEFIINSYKKSAVIAFELLSLFGADELFYSKNGHSKKSEEYAAKEFPYDIMLNPFQELDNAEIGEYTRYLIGWTNELDKRHNRLLKY